MQTVVIDASPIFAYGLQLILDKDGSNNFDHLNIGVEELIAEDQDISIDLIIVEIDENRLDSMGFVESLRKKYKSSKIVALSMFSNTKVVREAFIKGVDGYILKTVQTSEFLEGLEAVLEGETYMTEGLRLTPKKGHQPQSEVRQNLYSNPMMLKQKLTKRELEVLQQIVLAKSNREIGELLFISEQTVGVHKKNIMRKLNVHNTASLIRFAIDNNLA